MLSFRAKPRNLSASICDQSAVVQSKFRNPQSEIHMSIYRRVLRYYQPFWGQTILGLFLSLVGIALNLLKPWPFKIIVDDFLRPTSSHHADWRTWVPLLCLALVLIQFAWGVI